MSSGVQNIYVEVPNVDLDNIIIDQVKFNVLLTRTSHDNWFYGIQVEYTGQVTTQVSDFDLLIYNTETSRKRQREVNYLVKEFECKKSF